MALKKYEPRDIRNVVFVSHGGAGKTTLGEAILYDGKMTNRLGSVDDDSSILAFEPEEQRRRITIAPKLFYCDWKKTKLNFIDTPGDTNFFVETRLAMAVADAALVLVSAPDGVQVGTEMVWRHADEFALPRLVFVSKMDRERADFEAALEDIRKVLSDKAVAFQIPIGKEGGFEGVLDLLGGKAWTFPGDGRDPQAADIPSQLKEVAAKAREQLIEAIAASDDELLAKYLDTMELSEEEITRGLRKAIAERTVIPVLCGAAGRNLGVQPLLDALLAGAPSPAEQPPRKGIDPKTKAEIERKCSESEPFSALVWKTAGADIGRVSYLRVFSGKLTGDMTLHNPGRDASERPGTLYALYGKNRETLAEVGAGDMVALAKLKDTHTGDTLCDPKAPIQYAPPPIPNPVISFALRPRSKGDEDKVAAKLKDIVDQDPALQITHDQQSKEILLSGMGTIHIEANVEKLKRFGVDVELLPPKVPYRETIKGRAQNVEGKHKKQTGGKGQFGVCYINMEPLPRGSGFVFEDKIFGGAIPRQFIPSVEKGIRDRMQRGVVAGYPVVDLKVELIDGKYHDVDSDSRSFEFAGSKGFQAGFKQARPCLLEPIMKLEVTCPDENMGDVIGDINQRRGRVLGMEARGRNQVIKAQVPMSETLKYAADLRSITGGRGAFAIEFSHYEELPANLAEKIIAEAKVAHEEED
ncbi:MAG TPA: elongation factor G, partial [Polyangia bacterium]|nr:elongation factor G [Polyangia bacterium]